MKTIAIVLALTACMLAFSYAEIGDAQYLNIDVNAPALIVTEMIWVDANGVVDCSDDVIRQLCKSGRVCEVIGHRWDDSSDYSYGCLVTGCTYDHEWVHSRRCGICGKQQTRKILQRRIEEWVDE